MTHCRTQSSLKMLVKCTEYEHQTLVPHSCGHRHCPHCQHHGSQQWLERQMRKQVPAEYLLMTFTLPAEFRALAYDPSLGTGLAQQTVQIVMQTDWLPGPPSDRRRAPASRPQQDTQIKRMLVRLKQRLLVATCRGF